MTHSLDYFLHLMLEKQGSDLFVSSQLPVSAKINGELIALGDEKISAKVA